MKSVIDVRKYRALYEDARPKVKQIVDDAYDAVNKSFKLNGIAPNGDDSAEELVAAIYAYLEACEPEVQR